MNSSDPFNAPIIDPGFFTEEIDALIMREAVKAVGRLVAGDAWKDFVIAPYGQLANISTDDEIEAYARENSGTVFHPVGTASMSPQGASWGVVDPDLKVKGVDGLRVVDASVFVSASLTGQLNITHCSHLLLQPYIPAAHTTAPTYFIAERAADLIKESA